MYITVHRNNVVAATNEGRETFACLHLMYDVYIVSKYLIDNCEGAADLRWAIADKLLQNS